MNYLDRNNMAAARLKGLQEDLNLTNTEYSTCLSILYVGYIIMQVPSNMFINRISRPSLYIAVAMLLWGVISTLSGNTKNFGDMVAVRFLLGFVEAAFLPGALLILSKWYTRRELTTRNAILFCGNLISNAFSALVGAGVLSNMQGVMGHAAWRWLFWIEGSVTMFLAILAAFILPDLPHNARGFTEEERQVAQLRMIEDVGEADTDGEELGAFGGLLMALKDMKIYVMMLTFTAYVVGLSFNAFFVSRFISKSNWDPLLTRFTAYPHWYSRIRVCPDFADERSSLGFLLYCLGDQRMACRQNTREGLAHPRPDRHGSGWFRHLHGHQQRRSSLRRSIPAGWFLRRIHRILLLDQFLIPPSSCQASCCHCHDQRLQSTRQRRWLVRLGLGRQWVPLKLRNCAGHVRCDSWWMLVLPLDAGRLEPPTRGG